jgi:RimJ/RimL family protein N-acetyltransferase
MNFKIREMVMKDAQQIAEWKYDEPYSLYSMDGSQETIDEFMGGTYYSVYNENSALIGYFCYGETAQVPGGRINNLYGGDSTIDIGLGLRPDLTGKGIGLEFLNEGINFAASKFNPSCIRLTVATFNERAIKVYEKAGFIRGSVFVNVSPMGTREFMIMKKDII